MPSEGKLPGLGAGAGVIRSIEWFMPGTSNMSDPDDFAEPQLRQGRSSRPIQSCQRPLDCQYRGARLNQGLVECRIEH